MQIKNSKMSKLSIFVIGCLFCMSFSCFDCLDNSKFINGLLVLSIFTVIILMCENLTCLRYPLELLGHLFFSFIFLIMGGAGAQLNYFLMLLLACIFLNYREDILFKQLFISSAIGVIIFFILREMNIIQDDIYEHYERIRNTLGFGNSNTAAMFFYSFSSMLLLIKGKRKYINWILAIGVMSWCYYETKTRSILICGIVFVLSYIIIKKSFKYNMLVDNRRQKIMEKIIECIFIIVSLIPFYFSYIIKLFPQLDLISSGRLNLGLMYINEFTFRNWIIGGFSKYSELGKILIDNSFLQFISNYGIFFGIWSLSIVLRAVRNLVRNGNYLYLSHLLSYWIFGLFESLLFSRAMMGVVAFWIIVFKYAFMEEPLYKGQRGI